MTMHRQFDFPEQNPACSSAISSASRFYNDFNGYAAMNAKQIEELWSSGSRLNDAWFQFGDERNKTLFRASEPGVDGPNGQQKNMEHQLQWHLANGELIAFGVEFGSAADRGPVHIPKYFFAQRDAIDWDNNELSAFGRKFGDIRIIDLSKFAPDNDRSHISEFPSKTKDEMGRPTLIPKVCEIIRQINSENGFSGLSVKSIHNLIRNRCQKTYKTAFPKPTTPSKATINQALKRIPATVV